MDKQPFQTFLTDDEIEALRRIEAAYNIPRGKGRPSPSGLQNVKLSLAACVEIADWVVQSGMKPKLSVLKNGSES